MQRRKFIELTGLGMLGGLASPGFASEPASSVSADAKPTAASGSEADYAYGSGHFGNWVRDSYNLPAYQYTCNQTTDPKAVLPVNTAWRSTTDHMHHVGNDRLLAIASNYGYLQVRQDEGSPKFLNDFYPQENRYGAGIGFLADEDATLSTYYTGNNPSFERTLGVGYLRKTVSNDRYKIDQILFAPYGDDPVMISQVTITNRSNQPRSPRWVEYWGCLNYQFSYRLLMESSVQGSADAAPALRRAFGSRFLHRFQQVHNGAGLIDTQTFPDRSPAEEDAWQRVQDSLKKDPNGFYGAPVPPLAPGAAMEDLHPPATFLVSLDAKADGFATSASKFFAGGIENPAGMKNSLDNDLSASGPESALLLERRLMLKPGESRTIYFLYGYLPDGFTLDSLLAEYAKNPASHWPRSCARWNSSGLQFRSSSHPWMAREIAWSGYYLRSGFTYDSYFREHILSQGAGYQYQAGLQGAARDPLQHVLPFIFTDPQLVKEVIRYTLKEIEPDGSMPYGIVGSGVVMPCRYRPSDLQLWVLWIVAEYTMATRDTAFLSQRISKSSRESNAGDPTVLELLFRCYKFLTVTQGNGKHGLMRISNGDWNDSIVVNRLTPAQVDEATQHGESVLNSAMAGFVFDYYAQMLDMIGQRTRADQARAAAEAQRQAARAQWTGQWFRRAWLGEGLGWNGEKQLWLEPQPWAILGGAATPEQVKTLISSMDEMSRKPSPIGALLQSPADPTMKDEPGTGTNGGIFAAITGTLVWALAKVNGAMAWDEWKKNTLARHGAIYPDLWFGIWSGPDCYHSVLSKWPGGTGVDFPVLNMHSHAWPIYSAIKLLGTEFHPNGIRFQPVIALDDYEFNAPLLGFKKTLQGYSGWYAPSVAGHWSIEIALSNAEIARLKQIRVNGASQRLDSTEGRLRFSGSSRPGDPLRWEIS